MAQHKELQRSAAWWPMQEEDLKQGTYVHMQLVHSAPQQKPYSRKWRGTKKPLGESERGEWKVDLKLNIQKTKIMASGPITSWQIDRETVGTVSDYFGGL